MPSFYFSGENCEVEQNICISATPCHNGGSCIVTSISYKCVCLNGYAGPTCEQREFPLIRTKTRVVTNYKMKILYIIKYVKTVLYRLREPCSLTGYLH